MDDTEEDIAVIGIGCNFPGGEGLDNFWKILLEGKNLSVEIPTERFDAAFWCDADEKQPGKMQTSKAALIDGFDEFDCKFFGVSEVEADCMDPQQKLLLQCSYRALEDAGISTESISGSRTGVYIGLMNRDYEMLRNNNPSTITHYNGTGTAMSIAANRISFVFNLTGPSFAIDSACSSSLVALHVACQAIKQGDCGMALCGGVNCIIEPRVFVALSKAKMISPEGTSKPFSSRADGYGRGEGCGVVLLKPLKKAREDGNKIWGVISKTAVNQDGRSVTPITKPSPTQQEELLRGIYSAPDIRDVQYIEAHGTGTPVGDPTEAGSISNIIAKAKPTGSETLLIGSLKGNIGHTESAAGVAGLIKVLLMMKHDTIVPSVFYSEDSTSVDVKALNVKIQTKAETWEKKESSGRVAGINSFGFGGTNAHVILRECSDSRVPTLTSEHWLNLFVLSAATEKSLMLSITDTRQRLGDSPRVDLQAVCYTAACGRSHSKHKYRKAFLSSSLSDLERKLTSTLKTTVEAAMSDIKAVFVYCGNGVAFRGMCRQLMGQFPLFRDKVREIEDMLQKMSCKTFSISEWLAGEHGDKDFKQPNVVQPLLFAVQVGISTLLKHWGVKPTAVLGHSVGEVAAAHCSGLLSLEDAVKVLYHRSVLQSKVVGGKMLVVGNVSVGRIASVLAGSSEKVCIAAYNSPQSCTLSGEEEAVDVLHQRLQVLFRDENVFLRVLDVPAAYHSHMMEPVLKDMEKSIDVLASNHVECELLSTVSGEWCSDGDFCTGRYWARNIREPVLFEQTLRAAVKGKQSRSDVVFVEIGPRGALQRNIHDTLGSDTIVLPSARPDKDRDTLLSTVAKLFELGINVDWHQLYRGCETLPTAFPVYQFDHTKRELNFEVLRKGEVLPASSPHPLLSQTKHNREFTSRLSLETAPYLWEHKNDGVPIVPGAFYIELAFESVTASLRPKLPVSQLHLSVEFQSVFALNSDNHMLKVSLEHSEKNGTFKIHSSTATHASGTYRRVESQSQLEESKICLDAVIKRCKLVITREEIYSTLAHAGFEFGPLFRQLDVLHLGDEFKEAVTAVRIPGELLKHLHDYFIHPVVLDYFIQATGVLAAEHTTARQGFPSGIGSVAISRPLQQEMFIYLQATRETPDLLEVCGCFSSIEGDVLIELKGVRISFLGGSSHVDQLFFHNDVVAVAEERCLQAHKTKAIVFEDNLGIARRLVPHLSKESLIVGGKRDCEAEQVRHVVLRYLQENVDINNVLFMRGAEDLRYLSCGQLLERLVTHCEVFRQIVLGVKESKRQCAVRVITYRATEETVDHVSPGFVLSGMLRACAAEMAGVSFQLVDVASVTEEDIQTLSRVINTCKQQEIRIMGGQASSTRIARTSVKHNIACEDETVSQGDFVLHTSDPYKMVHLSAVPETGDRGRVQEKFVEIQLASVCVHTADYLPVSTTQLKFGKMMYWSKHMSHSHKLLALDFSGVVTAVGKDVQHLEVGDRVASCYPVVAATKIQIPERACFRTKKLSFLEETPCVSYVILAWSILQKVLTDVKKQNRKLVIVSSNSASVLMKVLALAANRSGWNVSSLRRFSEGPPRSEDCHAVIFLPPFDLSWQEMYDGGNSEKHLIFVCSSHMAPLPAGMPALENDLIRVHKLDVATLLQKANLLAHNKSISSWLQSLGFNSTHLPLRKELYTGNPQDDTDHDSYFTTNTVRQIVLDDGRSDSIRSGVLLRSKPRQLFRESCVYIVSGGLSGLGLETVKFIAQNGGSCIATLSRRILSDKNQLQMDRLQRRFGVKITHIQCDVSVSMQVEDSITTIGQRFPSCPIKGVFHSAAVLHDGLIEALDGSLFKKVLQPKVSGALNLHYATLHNKLDYFVCYSSISSFIGNASQCNYAAANSFLDTFCHYRRNLGLAGQAINWGPVNLGLLLNKNHLQKFLETKGMMTMNVLEVHEALKKCLSINRPQQVICKFNLRNLNIHVLSQNASLRERLTALVEVELEEPLGHEPKVQHVFSTCENVRSIVSEITNVGVNELVDDVTLSGLGIDSMLAMTLQNQIFQETGVNVPLVTILDPNSTLLTLVTAVSNNG